MNLLNNGDETSNVLFVNFNQDCTSLAVGSKKGFKLYSFNQPDNFEVIHENTTEDVRIVERLFSSSLVAIVSTSAPRKLKVSHFKKGTEICNYSYSNTILAVKLNRARLVVCLEESLYIHNIKDMKVLHTIRDTPPNPNGLCVLSISNDNCYLGYPGSSSIGEVQIFDALNLQAKSMIPAHDNPLAAMAFDPSGTKLATASTKGTVIRVFSVIDGTKLYELRRGVKRCVSIYSLSFSDDSVFLSASSNTETVHIFKLDESKDSNQSEEPQSWIGMVGKVIMQSASYLPSHVADMFNQGRSFATVHLSSSGMKNICAIATIAKLLRVIAVCSDGLGYVYNLDPLEGGDCTLIHTFSFLDDAENQAAAGASSEGGPIPIQPEQSDGGRSNSLGSTSYAAVVRGNEAGSAQESKMEKNDLDSVHPSSSPGSMSSSPPGGLRHDYDNEFPPMTQKSDA